MRIFGDKFVLNNKDKCKIIYQNRVYELKSNLKDIDEKLEPDNEYSLKLIIPSDIEDISYMFCNCISLLYIGKITKKNKSDIINIEKIPSEYDSSKTDENNNEKSEKDNEVNESDKNKFYGNNKIPPLKLDINSLNKFEKNCERNILSLQNIKKMNNLFEGCSSLYSIPDISNWNTSKVTNMSYMFNECKSLLILPDISKWDISNVKNIKNMFARCSSLISLPDISKWNTENITNISYLFIGCNSLNSIPDISKWIIKNVNEMHYMFFGCNSLVSLPDISKWKISDNIYISHLFYRCGSLSFLPNITKWNNNSNLTDLFSGCFNSLNIPLNY